MEDIYTAVVKIIGEHTRLTADKIRPESKLSLLGIDSLDIVEITFELELELDFDFSVPYGAETVGEFAKALLNQRERPREDRKTDAEF